MLCSSEIADWRFHLCELTGQTFCPEILGLDVNALECTGAAVCTV